MSDNISITEATKMAKENYVSDSAASSAVVGSEAETIIGSATGKKYTIRPLGIGKISEITDKITRMEKAMQEGIDAGKTEQQIILEKDSQALKIMAELMLLGVKNQHPEATVEDMQKDFSLGDFPKVYQRILDMNDFLSGMRNILNQG